MTTSSTQAHSPHHNPDHAALTKTWLRPTRVELPDGPATIQRLPGIPETGDGHTALFQATRTPPRGRTFVAGPGCAATALWAARAGAGVIHWTANVAEAISVSATFEANGPPQPAQVCAPDVAQLEPATCETALVHLPRGRERQRFLVAVAVAMLKTGGKLIFVGAKQEGIKGAVKMIAGLCGQAGIVARKGGYHAGMAYRPTGTLVLPQLEVQTYTVTVDHQPATLVSCPGVFAPDRLDMGAEALIQGMAIQPGTLVLELGCGTGLISLAAARRGARTISVDVSSRATLATARTLEANGYKDREVYLCCGAAAVRDAVVDTVVTNPPFHSGHDVNLEVAQRFVQEAARVLRRGGEIYLVANTFLDYGPWLRASFHAVEVVRQDSRFRVWRGTLPASLVQPRF